MRFSCRLGKTMHGLCSETRHLGRSYLCQELLRSCYEAVLHDLHRPGKITLGKAGSCLTRGLQLHYQIHQHCAQSMASLQCICI